MGCWKKSDLRQNLHPGGPALRWVCASARTGWNLAARHFLYYASRTYLRNQPLDKNDAMLPTLLRMARLAGLPILPSERRLRMVVTYRRRYVAVLVYVPAYAYVP